MPRQAISAGEKFGQRQAAVGYVAPVGVEGHGVPPWTRKGPPGWRAFGVDEVQRVRDDVVVGRGTKGPPRGA